MAKDGALLEHPRQQPVQSIGHPRDHKQDKAQLVAAFQRHYHQKRNQTDAQKRKQIGGIVKQIQWVRALELFIHGRPPG